MLAPTLVIGLGGTGKAVIYGVKRRLYQHFGVEKLPITCYIELDTDYQMFDNVTRNFDAFTRDRLKLEPEEFVRAEVSRDFIYTVKNDKKVYGNIHKWFPQNLFNYPPQVLKSGIGAGGLRPVGRLAFFKAIPDFQNKLANARKIHSGAALDQTKKIYGDDVGNDIFIFFVFSVAGGTGSGTFIDAAYFARQELETRIKPEHIKLYAIVALPQVFELARDDSSIDSKLMNKLLANGYAALSELEFFNSKEVGNISINWSTPEARGLKDFEPKGGPFDTIFLVSTKPSGEVRNLSKEEIFGMMADLIFESHLDSGFLSNFLAKEVDSTNAYTKDESLEIDFSTKYASFGISRIGFSRRGAQLAAIYSALSDIFEKYGKGSDNRLRMDEEPLYTIFGFDNNFPEKAEYFGEKNKIAFKLISDIVSKNIADTQTKLANIKPPENEISINELPRVFKEHVEKLFNEAKKISDSFDKRSNRFSHPIPQLPAQVRQNHAALLQQKVKGLTDYIKQVVLDKNERGILFAKNLLERTKSQIEELRNVISNINYGVSPPTFPSPPIIPTLSEIERIESLLKNAKEIKLPLFKKHAENFIRDVLEKMRKKYFTQLRQISEDYRKSLLDSLIQFIKSRMAEIALEEYKILLDKFERQVEDIEKLLDHFNEFAIGHFKEHFESYANSLMETEKSVRSINILAIRLNELKKHVFNAFLGKESDFEKTIMARVKDLLSETAFGKRLSREVDTVGDFLWEIAKKYNEASSSRESLYECFEKAANSLVNTDGSKIFNENFASVWSQIEAQEQVRQVASQGLPYFSPNSSSSVQDQSSNYAAVYVPETIDGKRIAETFKGILENARMSSPEEIKSRNDDRIVFFSIKYGLTLPQIREIEILWKKYEAYKTELDKTYYPHTDKRIRPLLKPLISNINNLSEIKSNVELLLSGFLWGVVVFSYDDEEKLWSVELPEGAGKSFARLFPTLFSSAVNVINYPDEIWYRNSPHTLSEYISIRIEEAKTFAYSSPEGRKCAGEAFKYAGRRLKDDVQFAKMLREKLNTIAQELLKGIDVKVTEEMKDKFLNVVEVPELTVPDEKYDNKSVLFVFKAPCPLKDEGLL